MRRLIPLLLLATLALLPAPAAAGVPSPFNSILDPCLIVCPLGDIPFTVRVRDIASNPVANSFVEVRFCDATSVHFCPPPGSCSKVLVTDAAGVVVFSFPAGGITTGSQVATIYADGVNLGTRPVASPDQDGSLHVTGADQAILAAKLGAADPTGLLACNLTVGVVTQADLDVQLLHMGHACGAVVPVEPQSWGSLKLIYR